MISPAHSGGTLEAGDALAAGLNLLNSRIDQDAVAALALLPLAALPFIDVRDVSKRTQKERPLAIPAYSSSPEA